VADSWARCVRAIGGDGGGNEGAIGEAVMRWVGCVGVRVRRGGGRGGGCERDLACRKTCLVARVRGGEGVSGRARGGRRACMGERDVGVCSLSTNTSPKRPRPRLAPPLRPRTWLCAPARESLACGASCGIRAGRNGA
jgi:hypothetical protein